MRLGGLFILFTACSFSGATPPDQTDVDAAIIDAPPGPCDPNTAPVCVSPSVLRTCAEDGSGFEDTQCPVGCVSGAPDHCGEFTPANGVGFGPGNSDIEATGQWDLDSDTGQIFVDMIEVRPPGQGLDLASGIAFNTVTQNGTRDIGVFGFGSLVVSDSAVVRVRGVAAVALVSPAEISVFGLIDVSGGAGACVGDPLQSCAGPGGGDGGPAGTDGDSPDGNSGVGEQGDDGGGQSNDGEGGGGGGGFGGDGGNAGNAASGADGGDGGQAWGSADLTPLTGGSGGGGGATEPTSNGNCSNNAPYPGGIGGGAGGGIQIVSGIRVVFSPGAGPCGVNAGGGGGGPGGCRAGGGGGASGGGILVEAPRITVDGTCMLAANGGGGGTADNEANDSPGTDGLLSATAAAGTGQGGDGAARDDGAQNSPNNSNETAGGGGGVGKIVLRALDGQTMVGQQTSPAETAEVLVVR